MNEPVATRTDVHVVVVHPAGAVMNKAWRHRPHRIGHGRVIKAHVIPIGKAGKLLDKPEADLSTRHRSGAWPRSPRSCPGYPGPPHPGRCHSIRDDRVKVTISASCSMAPIRRSLQHGALGSSRDSIPAELGQAITGTFTPGHGLEGTGDPGYFLFAQPFLASPLPDMSCR